MPGPVTSILDADISGFVSKMQQAKGQMTDTAKEGEGIGARITKGLSTAGTVIGGTIGTIGAGVLALAEPAARAQDLLTVAIRNTGGAYSDSAFGIDNAVTKQERYGHGVADTKEALAKLVQAMHDPKKALEEMAFVTDLAANKHISLSDAATMDAKMMAGSGKLYKEFGINVKDATALLHEAEAATKAHTAAVALNQADVTKLEELQARLAAKYSLSVGAQQALRLAEDAVTAARAKGNVPAIHKAEQALADLRARQAAGMQMSVSDQQALAHAQDAVKDSGDAVVATAAKQDAATKIQADSAKTLGSAHDQLKKKLKGTADEIAASQPFWVGAKTHVENMISAIGPGLSSAMIVTGPAIAALAQGADTSFGHAIGRFAAHRAADVADGVKWAAGHLASSAKWIGGMIADGARFAVIMAARGAIIAANFASAAAIWIAETAVFVAQQAIRLAVWLAANAALVATAIATGIATAAAFMLPLLPFILIGLAVAGLVVLVVTHFDQIKNAVTGAVGFVINWVKANWPLLLAILTGPFGLAVLFIAQHFDQIKKLGAGLVDAFLHLGSDIVNGLINGITGAWHLVVDTIGKLATSLPGPLKTVLGIHSPSTVFAEQIGRPIVEGIAMGIDKSDAAQQALARKIAVSTGGAIGGGGAPGAAFAIASSATGGAGGGNVYVTVQGPVFNLNDTGEMLADSIRNALLRRKRTLGSLGLA